MGAVASVIEAIARRCHDPEGDSTPDNVDDQHRLVVSAPRSFGLHWRYANNCPHNNHHRRQITPDQSARLRDATVITIPHRHLTSVGGNVEEFFRLGQPSNLSIPTQSLCPYCAASVSETVCDWSLLPWSSQTAPDRVFFRFTGVF